MLSRLYNSYNHGTQTNNHNRYVNTIEYIGNQNNWQFLEKYQIEKERNCKMCTLIVV